MESYIHRAAKQRNINILLDFIGNQPLSILVPQDDDGYNTLLNHCFKCYVTRIQRFDKFLLPVLVYYETSDTILFHLLAARNKQGDTVLHVAFGIMHTAVIKNIITKFDAKDFYKVLRLKNNMDNNVFHTCFHNIHIHDSDNMSAAKYLVLWIKDQTSLQLLLADANLRLQTPLHVLMWRSFYWESNTEEMVIDILERITDKDVRKALMRRQDDAGWTILHFSIIHKHDLLTRYICGQLFTEEITELCETETRDRYSLFQLAMMAGNSKLFLFFYYECLSPTYGLSWFHNEVNKRIGERRLSIDKRIPNGSESQGISVLQHVTQKTLEVADLNLYYCYKIVQPRYTAEDILRRFLVEDKNGLNLLQRAAESDDASHHLKILENDLKIATDDPSPSMSSLMTKVINGNGSLIHVVVSLCMRTLCNHLLAKLVNSDLAKQGLAFHGTLLHEDARYGKPQLFIATVESYMIATGNQLYHAIFKLDSKNKSVLEHCETSIYRSEKISYIIDQLIQSEDIIHALLACATVNYTERFQKCLTAVAEEKRIQVLQSRCQLGDSVLHFIMTSDNIDMVKTMLSCIPCEVLRGLLLLDDSWKKELFSTRKMAQTMNILWDSKIRLWDLLSVETKKTVLLNTDSQGQTMLHHIFETPTLAKFTDDITRAIKEYKMEYKYVTMKDKSHATAIELGFRRNHISQLDYLFDNLSQETINRVIERVNHTGQNLFSYSAIRVEASAAWEILLDQYSKYPLKDVLNSDHFGNNPLHHAICTSQDPCELLVKILKRLDSWTEMRSILVRKNDDGISVVDVCHLIYGKEHHSKKRLVISESLIFSKGTLQAKDRNGAVNFRKLNIEAGTRVNLKDILHFLLSCYGLLPLDNGAVIHLTMMPAIQYVEFTNQRSLTLSQTWTPAQPISGTDSLILSVLYNEGNWFSPKDMQEVYLNMDGNISQGDTKVVVVHTDSLPNMIGDAYQTAHLDPAYPDYIIFVVHHNDISQSSKSILDCQMWVQSGEASQLLHRMRFQCNQPNDEIAGVTIISTTTRMLNYYDTEPNSFGSPKNTKYILSPYPCYDVYKSESKCRALILCNTKDRKAKGDLAFGWEEELADTTASLSQFFSLEVVQDLDAKDMVATVRQFASSSEHGSVAALAVLSHGITDGRICGNTLRDNDTCTVTELTQAMDTVELRDKPKLVFLEFCRGDRKTRNKMARSAEMAIVKKHFSFPSIGVHKGKRRKLCAPDRIPHDFFVVYSTLHDSRSHRGLFWRQAHRHLTELTVTYPDGSLTEIENLFVGVSHRVKLNSGHIQFPQYTSTLKKRLIFHIPPSGASNLQNHVSML